VGERGGSSRNQSRKEKGSFKPMERKVIARGRKETFLSVREEKICSKLLGGKRLVEEEKRSARNSFNTGGKKEERRSSLKRKKKRLDYALLGNKKGEGNVRRVQ